MKKCVMIFMALCLAFSFASASAAATDSASLPSLKEFYADYFDFGSAVSSRELNSASRRALLAAQYSIITPENELKPENVISVYNSAKASAEDQGNVSLQFYSAKPLLDFAWQNGLKVHGHVLFWHSQTPDTFFRVSYSKSEPYVSREVMLQRMENYVRSIMAYLDENYPGLVVSWDVVNEAIDDSTGGLRTSNFTKIVGEDWVLQAFRFARQYAPEGTLLFYNDYSVPYQPKLNGILALLDDLIAEDVVDGCGFQCHYQLTTPTVTQLKTALRKVTETGLLVRVSEMDILVNANTDAEFAKQARRYGDIMRTLLTFSDSVIAVQTWGTSDNLSWKSGNYPLLFNRDLTPKPAFDMLVNTGILP